jgi:hypothetical protein
MRAVKISCILDGVVQFESGLKVVYDRVSRDAVRGDIEMLASYISRHRKRIEQALSQLPEQEIEKIRNTPLPYEPQAADWHCISEFDFDSIASVEDLINAAIKFDDCLINLYDQVARQAVNQQTKDLFQSLRCIEQNDEITLMNIKAEGII